MPIDMCEFGCPHTYYSWPCTFIGFDMRSSHAHMYVLQLVCVTFVRESIARKKVSISEGVAGANYFFTNIQHILLIALHVYRVQYAFQPRAYVHFTACMCYFCARINRKKKSVHQRGSCWCKFTYSGARMLFAQAQCESVSD